MKSTNKTLLFFIILITVIIIYFYPVIFKGQLIDSNGDAREHNIPFLIHSLRAFQSGEIPQWNPYIFCGNNFISSGANNFFYPLNIPLFCVSENFLLTAIQISAILHFIFAGLFTFYFFYEYFKDFYSAIIASLAYLLAAPAMLHIITGYIIWFYLPLWLYINFTFEKRKIYVNLILNTTIIALIFSAGNLQTSLYGIILGALTIFYNFNTKKIVNSKKILSNIILILSFIFGIAIAAIKLIPFYFAISGNLDKLPFTELSKLCETKVIYFINLFLPFIFNNKINLFEIFPCYIGIIPGIFMIYAMFFIWNRKILIWKIIIIIIIMIILNTPLAYLQYLVIAKAPLFFSRWAYFLPLCFAVLFCNTWQLLSNNYLLKKIRLFSIYIFGIIILYLIIFQSNFLSDKIILYSILYFICMYFIGFIIISLIIKNSFTKFYKCLLCLIIILDILLISKFTFNFHENPDFTEAPYFNFSPDILRSASEFSESNNNFRIFTNISHNSVIPINLYNVSGYDNIINPYIIKLFNLGKSSDRFEARQVTPKNIRGMQLTSVKYILNNNSDTFILNSLPRVKLFTNFIVIPEQDENKILSNLLSPDFDYYNKIILTNQPELNIKKSINPGNVSIIKETTNKIIITAECAENSLLMITDTYDNGWSAYINNIPAKIYRANFAFKAVAIPAGNHTIIFSYESSGLTIGKYISIISFIFFLLLIIICYFIERKIKKDNARFK